MKVNKSSIKWQDVWRLPLSKFEDIDYIYSSNGVLILSDFKDEWCFNEKIINKVVDIINGDIESDFLPEWQSNGIDIFYQKEYVFHVRGWGYLVGLGGLNLPTDIAEKIQDEFILYTINRLNGKVTKE